MRELIGPAWLILAALCAFGPALAHGGSIGPYQILKSYGLAYDPHVAIPAPIQHDIVTQMIPWSTLSWLDVHHGHLPLWNSYNVLGTPLAFNWQSASFSVPSLIGYLFPLHLTYTVQCIATTIIAGCGAYFFCRTAGLGVLAATFSGTVFELGGAFFTGVGWPIAGVFSWLGWMLGAIVLIQRRRHRMTGFVLLAVSSALSVYAGQPDCLVIAAMAVAVFLLVQILRDAGPFGGTGVTLPFARDSLLALGIGICLSAPLLLPGAQLISASSRSATANSLNANAAMNFHDFITMLVGFDGSLSPVAMGIGAVAVVFACVALVQIRRNRHVMSVFCVGLVAGLIALSNVAIDLLTRLPLLHAVRWPRSITVMLFALAVLAGFGLDRFVRHPSRRRITALAVGFSIALGAVLLLWAFGAMPPITLLGFQWPYPKDYRSQSLLAEGLLAALGLLLALFLLTRPTFRRGSAVSVRWTGAVGALLLLAQTSFLVVNASHFWATSPGYVAPSPAEIQLQRVVGSSVVGLTNGACFSRPALGILPNINILSRVHEMAVYDPMLPKAYYQEWETATGSAGGVTAVSTFCPAIPSASVARQFGVSYVLVAPSARAPTGTHFVERIGKGIAAEDLYRVPGAAAATLAVPRRDGSEHGSAMPEAPLRVREPDASTWILVTDAHSPRALHLHLTASPGWHATLDGKPLALSTYRQFMLQAHIPAGRHRIVLTYWPTLFTVGLVLGACAALALIVLVVLAWNTRRRGPQSH